MQEKEDKIACNLERLGVDYQVWCLTKGPGRFVRNTIALVAQLDRALVYGTKG
jgi:hypothetical protein